MWCRRPEGAKVIAWSTGCYAVDIRLVGESSPVGYHAFFDDKGKPVVTAPEIAKIVNNPNWREVTVELDDDSYCRRCAVIRDRGGA